MSEHRRVLRARYGGSFTTDQPAVTLPFVAPGDLVALSSAGEVVSIVEPGPGRTTPQCLHFGSCGGCQYQMLTPEAQVATKRDIFTELLAQAGVATSAPVQTHRAAPYGYRNRVRLRVQPTHQDLSTQQDLRLGYNMRGTTEFLPVSMCPIAEPALWTAAQALLAASTASKEIARLFATTAEVELLCDHTASRLLITLFCTPRTKVVPSTLAQLQSAIQARLPFPSTLAGIGAAAFDLRSGPTGRLLASTGAAGVAYSVPAPFDLAETYWIARGAFFQVNRFLLPTLVELVCAGHSGALAFDLFAGVGLFSRVLARSFRRVVAVEANPAAAGELRSALGRLSPDHTAVAATTLDFLHSSLLQRERPELVVLDPPRAGAGPEACGLLCRLAPDKILYLSCDPTTLARDLAVLTTDYRIAAMHLIDLFPQTFHIETLVVLERVGK